MYRLVRRPRYSASCYLSCVPYVVLIAAFRRLVLPVVSLEELEAHLRLVS
jgi:hypothetical protein